MMNNMMFIVEINIIKVYQIYQLKKLVKKKNTDKDYLIDAFR